MPKWAKIMLIIALVLVSSGAGVAAGYFIRISQRDKDGQIKISSSPSGANVCLDGKNMKKTTPYTVKKVSKGMHRIKLTMKGYEDWSTTVEVEEGEKVEVVATLVKTEAEATSETSSGTREDTRDRIDEDPAQEVDNEQLIRDVIKAALQDMDYAPGDYEIVIEYNGGDDATARALPTRAGLPTYDYELAIKNGSWKINSAERTD